jgi:hypothetical protein
VPDEQAQRMVEPTLRAEESEFEPMVVQRRIFLLFCATVLTGVLLCTAYDRKGTFISPWRIAGNRPNGPGHGNSDIRSS